MSTVHGRRQRTVASHALLAGVGGFLAAWGLVGDVSEPGGSDQIISAPTAPRWLELVVAAVGVATVVFLFSRVRVERDLRSARGLMSLFVVGGVGLALALRLLSARTAGANIGGGMVMIVLPFAIFAFASFLIPLWRRGVDGD